MRKGPSESQELPKIQKIKLRDIEPGKEYVVAKDTLLHTGPANAPSACARLPKNTSFGIAKQSDSSLQLHFKGGVSVYFVMSELNTDEIEVFE